MPGCVQNIINTVVFVRFAVWEKFEFQLSRGRLWASFWEALGDPGVTFSRFEAIGKRLEFQRISDDFGGVPKSTTARLEGKSLALKALLPTYNCRLQTEISNL